MYYARMILSLLHHRRTRMRAAYTLLEMSIVVVIIALLTGGILATQSYIHNGQLSTSVQEAQYYMDAFNQFSQKYGTVPGDLATATDVWPTTAGVATGNGDGNGFIRAPAATNNTNEYWYAWEHLADAKLIAGLYNGTTGAGGTAQAVLGTNIPQSSVDGVGFLFDHPDVTTGVISGDPLYFDGTYFHVLRLAAILPSDTGLPLRAYMTPREGYELDAKYDDGNPGTGWITTPKHSALVNCTDTDTAASALYNVAYHDKACYFIFKLQ